MAGSRSTSAPGQQRQRQHELLHAGHHGWLRLAEGRRLLERRQQLQLDRIRRGYAAARFPTAVSNDCLALSIANPNTPTAWCQAQIARDGLSIYDLKNISLYAQDSFTRGRLNTQPRHPLRLQPRSGAGGQRRGQPARAGDSAGDQLPGRRSGREVQRHLAARRADLRPERRRQDDRQGELRDVLGSGRHRWRLGIVNPLSRESLRYPWTDTNGDKFIQANELTWQRWPQLLAVPPVTGTRTTRRTRRRPTRSIRTSRTTHRRVHRRLRPRDRPRVRGRRQLHLAEVCDFTFDDTLGIQPSDYAATQFTPAASACPGAKNARCPTVTYYQPAFQLPTVQPADDGDGPLQPDVQRRRSDGAEAAVASLADEHELLVQQHDREQRLRRRSREYDPRGPEEPGHEERFQYDYLAPAAALATST